MTDDNPRGAILAAELAVVREDYDRAEDALLESLSRVRRRRQEAHGCQ